METGNNKGFEIALDRGRQILRVKAWGAWDKAFMKKYMHAFTENAEEFHALRKEWSALMDLTSFSPETEEVRRILQDLITNASALGLKKLACIGRKAILPTLFSRLFVQIHREKCLFAESEDEALT